MQGSAGTHMKLTQTATPMQGQTAPRPGWKTCTPSPCQAVLGRLPVLFEELAGGGGGEVEFVLPLLLDEVGTVQYTMDSADWPAAVE